MRTKQKAADNTWERYLGKFSWEKLLELLAAEAAWTEQQAADNRHRQASEYGRTKGLRARQFARKRDDSRLAELVGEILRRERPKSRAELFRACQLHSTLADDLSYPELARICDAAHPIWLPVKPRGSKAKQRKQQVRP